MFGSDQHRQHISGQFNHELETLKHDILAMGGLVESQLNTALESLIERNSEKAIRVIKRDAEVNNLEVKIDQECARILARRQPAASDLRLVLAIIKINMDLERVGDEAAKIARQAKVIIESNVSGTQFVQLRRMGRKIVDSLRAALDALARHDAGEALLVVQGDSSVDQEYARSMQTLVADMKAEPHNISTILNEIWALKALERIGDHASNIGEHIIYLVRGQDVRHMAPDAVDDRLAKPH